MLLSSFFIFVRLFAFLWFCLCFCAFSTFWCFLVFLVLLVLFLHVIPHHEKTKSLKLTSFILLLWIDKLKFKNISIYIVLKSISVWTKHIWKHMKKDREEKRKFSKILPNNQIITAFCIELQVQEMTMN